MSSIIYAYTAVHILTILRQPAALNLVSEFKIKDREKHHQQLGREEFQGAYLYPHLTPQLDKEMTAY